MQVYRITRWHDHFENNRTRELKRLDWVPVPNKMDGDGYTELVGHDNGAAHLGAWLAIVEVASKCDPRGTLLRENLTPHDAGSLSRVTRLPTPVFTEVLPRLVRIGWVELYNLETQEVITIPQDDAIKSQDAAHIEGKGREGKSESASALSRLSDFAKRTASTPEPRICWTKLAGWSEITQDDMTAWREAYPACDIDRQLRDMHEWLKANPEKAHKSRWRRFITNWLRRSQERGGDKKSNAPGFNSDNPSRIHKSEPGRYMRNATTVAVIGN